MKAWTKKLAEMKFSAATVRDPKESSDALSISSMIDIDEEMNAFEEVKNSATSQGLCTPDSHPFMARRETRLAELAKEQFREVQEFTRVQFAPFTRYIDTNIKFDVAIQELNELRAPASPVQIAPTLTAAVVSRGADSDVGRRWLLPARP